MKNKSIALPLYSNIIQTEYLNENAKRARGSYERKVKTQKIDFKIIKTLFVDGY